MVTYSEHNLPFYQKLEKLLGGGGNGASVIDWAWFGFKKIAGQENTNICRLYRETVVRNSNSNKMSASYSVLV